MTVEIYPGLTVGGIGTLPLDVVQRDGGLKVLQNMLSGDLPAYKLAHAMD